ncbi:MAG: MBG domain-containing protein [Ferruginibacter sp.]
MDSLIVYVRPYYRALSNIRNNGIAVSAGDTAIRSNLVREGYQLQGAGIKVGVISDSYNAITAATTNPVITNTAAQDVRNGDLPGVGNPYGDNTPVNVLQDYPGSSDEGRAMLQIVHDVAPKAELYFRTGFLSPGDFALGIQELNQAGCNIIVDDVTYITEPFLKDGVVANAVDAAVKAGSTYFSAAGNFANQSYENTFNPVPAPGGIRGTAHNFRGSAGNDVFQSVNLSPGNYVIVLQWLDDIYSLGQTSSGGTKNDLDIYLTPNTDGTALFGFNRNNTNGDPIEILPFAITSPVQTNILITNNTTSSNPARFKYVVFKGDIKINEYQSGSSTIVGQANSAGAIAVGAVSYKKVFPYPIVDSVEAFSSIGGTFINNEQRRKPELVAPDGVNTTVDLGADYDKDKFSNFFGTSAATPHAAGVAALIMEGRKKFLNQASTTPDEIRTILQSTATDMITAGFDFTSGYGFINADSAMRTFAKPRPAITQLVYPSTLTPGDAAFTLTVKGKYLSYNSVIRFRDAPLPTKVLNPGEAIVTIPAFIGNPAISIYTPPASVSGLDGGASDSMYFSTAPKKIIIVTADNKTKKYGQQLPAFTATILIDSILIQNTKLTLKDIGLDTMSFITLANADSSVGTYSVRPSRIFNPLDSIDRGLSELYKYIFNTASFITIEKLPVTVTPLDTTITYGQKIPGVQFTYQFDGANIPDSVTFLNNIQSAHQSQFAKDTKGNDVFGLVNGKAVTILNGKAVTILNGKAVTILNGKAVTILNGQPVPVVNAQALTIVNGVVVDTSGIDLTSSQVQKLNFLTTLPSLQNARQITNQTLVNGTYVTGTTNVIDITQESILDYNENAAQTYMLKSVSDVDAKGLADIESFVNGKAVTILNGKAVTILNGKAVTILNGKAVTILNGKAVTILNGDTIPIVSSQNKTAVIIDSTEIGVDPPSPLKSLNMITGLDVGNQFIIPGSLLNDNFEITYGLGKLKILPAPLTIKANDTMKVYGEPLILSPTGFTIGSGVLMYDDAIQHVTLTSAGAGANGQGGIHPIIPSNAVGSAETDLSNYAITYLNGALTISKASVIVKANNASKIYGNANPVFTASYTGLVNNQAFANSGITGSPAYSTTATANSSVGDYDIVITKGSLSSPNYSFSFAGGTLTITKACLTVKADDKVIYKGDPLPAFTSRITTLKAGDQPAVAYTLSPSCTGAAGVYTIIPRLNNFANSKNYTISYVNGKLYINPKGWDAKKLRPYLDCVEQLSTGSYIAHFYCINDNGTPVYVQVGSDNKLSSSGSFESSQQPFIFVPGITRFNVPFDGSSLKWELKTYDCFTKTLTSASASASSGRCNSYTETKSANKTAVVIK